jgi:hypothetical protein
MIMATEVELFDYYDLPGRPHIRGVIDSNGQAQIRLGGVDGVNGGAFTAGNPVVTGVTNPVTGGLTLSANNVFVPQTNDTTGIEAAQAACAAVGGGLVFLVAAVYNISRAIQLQNNVTISGSGWKQSAFQSNSVPNGGTLIKPIGSGFNAFEAKTIDLGVFDGMAAFLMNSGVIDLAISGAFTNGISIGALNSAGPYNCTFKNLYIRDCTQWGIFVENSETCFVTNVQTENCRNGIYWGGSTSAWNGGDTVFNYVYPTSYDVRSRNLQLGTRNGASLNGMRLYQSGGLGPYINSYYTENISVTSGGIGGVNGTIPVADLSKYDVGMPVLWNPTAPTGFTAKVVYFVKTMSGTTGAGNITLCAKDLTDVKTGINSSPLITPTSTGTFTLQNKGFSGIALIGCTYGGLYDCFVENAGVALALIQDSICMSIIGGNIQAADNVAFPYANNFWAFALRSCTSVTINSVSGNTVDSNCVYTGFGMGVTSPNQNGSSFGGIGVRSNGSWGGLWLNTRMTPDLVPTGNGYANLSISGALKYVDIWFNGNFTLNASTSFQNSPCIVFYGTALGTLTFPSGFVRGDCNIMFTVTNVSTQNCTLQLPAGSYFVRGGVRTASGGSTVVLPNTSVMITMIWDTSTSGVVYAVAGA